MMAGSLAVGYEDFCDLELAWLPLGEKRLLRKMLFPCMHIQLQNFNPERPKMQCPTPT